MPPTKNKLAGLSFLAVNIYDIPIPVYWQKWIGKYYRYYTEEIQNFTLFAKLGIYTTDRIHLTCIQLLGWKAKFYTIPTLLIVTEIQD